MAKFEVLFDAKVSADVQYAIYLVNEVYRKALEKYPPSPIVYNLHYSFSVGGREIPQSLLETLYVFRNKLKSVKSLPSREEFFLKVVKRPEKYKVFVDMSIYDSLLNAMRGLVYSENDDVYYKKVIDEYQKALSGEIPDWVIEALDPTSGKIISKDVIHSYHQTKKMIAEILKDKDFDYAYNGILQHSDKRFRSRYIKDVEEGSAMYITFKCAILANQIREILLSSTVVFDEIVNNNRNYLGPKIDIIQN